MRGAKEPRERCVGYPDARRRARDRSALEALVLALLLLALVFAGLDTGLPRRVRDKTYWRRIRLGRRDIEGGAALLLPGVGAKLAQRIQEELRAATREDRGFDPTRVHGLGQKGWRRIRPHLDLPLAKRRGAQEDVRPSDGRE